MTSSIDIAAVRRGVRYIPAHEILGRNNASLAIPVGRQKLIPDQLFALDYGGSYRSFMLEVDRGTEPGRSASARKSLARSIEQYNQVIEGGLYKKHYGLRANLLVLYVFNSRSNEERFLDMVGGCSERVRRTILSRAVNGHKIGKFVETLLVEQPWYRAGLPGVSIGY